MSIALSAGFWGLISALSLVMGSVVGVYCPISHTMNGLFMAFGAGALLFAVAIEMFAHGLREMDEKEPGARRYMYILMGFAVFGGVMFTVINRILTGGDDNSVSHAAKKEGGSLDRSSRDSRDLKADEKAKDYSKVDTEENKVEQGGDAGGHGSGNPNAAFSIWLGILIDGVPESMLIGFMASAGELSLAFIVAVFLANFPEAMSASALMKRNGDATSKIIFMWSILFVGTGAIAFLTVLAFPEKKEGIPEPEYQRFAATASEGVAGGAMMACIATAMLPEAFEEGGDMAGVSTLMGFLASLVVKLSMEGTHEAHGTVMEAACPSPLMHPLP